MFILKRDGKKICGPAEIFVALKDKINTFAFVIRAIIQYIVIKITLPTFILSEHILFIFSKTIFNKP